MSEKAQLAADLAAKDATSFGRDALIIRHLYDITRRKHTNLNGRLEFDFTRANLVDIENMIISLHQHAFRSLSKAAYKLANVAEPVQNIRNVYVRNRPLQADSDISQMLTRNAIYDAHFIPIMPEQCNVICDVYLFPIQPVMTQMRM